MTPLVPIVLVALSWSCGTESEITSSRVPAEPPPGLDVASDTTSTDNGATVLAFIALPPGTRPAATRATFRDAAGHARREVTLVDGGFDPVPIVAASGDVLQIVFDGGSSFAAETVVAVVPPKRRPRVVRTSPPNGKRDVPLNPRLSIVFSEPMDAGSITGATIRLLRGAAAVTGHVELDGVVATFVPERSLEANTEYTLVVTDEARDLDLDRLEAPVSVSFITEAREEPEPPAVAVRARPLAAGLMYTCALDASGAAFCWGKNTYGQLGDGTTATTSRPVAVRGGLTFASVASGAMRTCALTAVGDTYCWGDSYQGSLPHRVAGVPRFATISLTHGHVCGLTGEGEAWCWGDNTGAQLGNGSPPDDGPWGDGVSAGPSPVLGGLRFTRIVTGRGHTCGLVESGAAYCWGWNGEQQLGIRNLAYATEPALVEGGLTFVELTAGSTHTCGITTSGAIHCWGSERYSELGTAAAGRFSRISAGGGRTCALTVAGAAYCWGEDISGYLWGDGTRYSEPVAVPGYLAFAEISAGVDHVCGLTRAGTWYCWGHNEQGQLGGGQTLGWVPAPIESAIRPVNIVAGQLHTCTLSSEGRAFCWGDGRWGQLGTGATASSAAPQPVASSMTFTSIAAHALRTCAVATTGATYCWGADAYDAVSGRPEVHAAPILVPTAPTFTSVVVGRDHACGLAADGRAHCWGDGTYGQLGVANLVRSATPLVIPGPVFESLTAGGTHTCGITDAGAAYCWGDNVLGQLGVRDVASSATPRLVQGGRRFATLSAGNLHTCGVTVDGAAYCWGSNQAGELGTPASGGPYPSPQPVLSARRFSAISAGYGFTCGVEVGGDGYCWGSNSWGALGDGTREQRGQPVRVSVEADLRAISAGAYHVCALAQDMRPYCWGEVHHGQLGRGYGGHIATPVAVLPLREAGATQ